MAWLPLSDALQRRIRAGLLRVHSKKLAGAKLSDCLKDAYDVYARAFDEVGEPLTDELFSEHIPPMVFDAAVEYKWVPYRLVRPRGRGAIVGSFLRGGYNPARYEEVPQAELTETFGSYKVPKGYGASFTQHYLECRIAHWRAEAATRELTGDSLKRERTRELPSSTDGTMPKEPLLAVAADTDNSKGTDTREQVDAFIERIFSGAKGRRITRTDIWRVAGYTDATQFQRFQRNKKGSAGSIAKFTKILKLTPAEFLERLDGLGGA